MERTALRSLESHITIREATGSSKLQVIAIQLDWASAMVPISGFPATLQALRHAKAQRWLTWDASTFRDATIDVIAEGW